MELYDPDKAMELYDPDKASGEAILDAIRTFVVAERRRNFAFLARYNHSYMEGEELSVYLAFPEEIVQACRLWDCKALDLTDSQWYTFRQQLTSLIDTVPVRHVNSPTMVTSAFQAKDILEHQSVLEALDIDDTKKWMDIRAWMRKKLEWNDEYERKFVQLQAEEQIIWWRKNKKFFPLLLLPGELRETIYLEAISTVILPRVRKIDKRGNLVQFGHTWVSSVVNFGSGHSSGEKGWLGTRRDPDVEAPNLNILLVNRQVHNEAKHAVWKGATKRFRVTLPTGLSNPWMVNAVNCLPVVDNMRILQVRDLAPPMALTHVQLELSAICYFELIGIRPHPGSPMASYVPHRQDFHINILKDMKTIKNLDFRFMSSKHPDAMCPWSYNASEADDGSPVKHSCQKVWIEWFFIFALEHLRGINARITMSGCIKDVTRVKWEGILAQERKGNRRDMTIPMRSIRLAKRDDDPIPCHCKIPCYRGAEQDWSRFDGNDQQKIGGLEAAMDEQYWSFSDPPERELL